MPQSRPIGPHIVRTIHRPDPADLAALSRYGVATLHEAYGRRGLMRSMRPVVPDTHICGTAVTSLNAAGDNLMLHAAVELCQPGDVLVVTTTAPSNHGMFGDLLAEQCRAQGIAGVILDAGARDSNQIREMRYPVWSTSINASGTSKVNPGWVNVPVVCDGVTVGPGDIVVADDDGVVVIAQEHIREVIAAAAAREDNEQRDRERFAAGELSLDVGNLRTVLDRLGVVYIDH
jgi:4-hydroxy-4-methyl-2-oxoglutarate aldolase